MLLSYKHKVVAVAPADCYNLQIAQLLAAEDKGTLSTRQV